MPPGSIELKLHDMVRAAKSSEHCTIKMAKENATPRFSIFRSKRMRGWWPFIKLKDQEDEEREKREDKQKKKKKKWSSSVKPEDVEFTDPSGNTYLLTVRQGAGTGEQRASVLPLPTRSSLSHTDVTYRGSNGPAARDFVQGPEDLSHLLQIWHFVCPEVSAAVALQGVSSFMSSSGSCAEQCSARGAQQKACGSPSTRQDSSKSLS